MFCGNVKAPVEPKAGRLGCQSEIEPTAVEPVVVELGLQILARASLIRFSNLFLHQLSKNRRQICGE